MSEAITTNAYRRKLAEVVRNGGTLSPITHMAFGDGGHNPETFSAIAPDPEQTELNHELIRKPLSLVTQEDEFSVTGQGILDKSDVVGYVISEVALIDADGMFVGLKSLGPKTKDSTDDFETNIKLRF